MEAVTAGLQRVLPAACGRPVGVVDAAAAVLSDGACFKATLSLALGVGIVFLAGLIKLPQIANVVGARSAEGLALATLLIETFGYAYNLAAHYRLRYPVSTYGDFAVLLLQNGALIVLLHRYSGRAAHGPATVAAFVALIGVMCSPAVPIGVLKLMTLGNVPVTVASRVPQILKNYHARSTGTLSAITCCGLFLGSCARVFTTVQDVGNVNILLGYVTSATLNGVIALQVLVYGRRGADAAKKAA